MQLSVIIPCLNAGETIRTQLEALARQHWSGDWEVIVADNGSTDDTRSIAASYASRIPSLRVVDASQRRGSAYARNAGVRAAQGRSIAFCDADDEVADGWVAAIGAALQHHELVASRFDGSRLNSTKKLGVPQQHGLDRLWYSPFLPHAGGCGLGVQRGLHERIGGFDESLPRLMDTDYCIRAQLAGASLHFVPDALVHVRMRETGRELFRQTRIWARYNTLLHARYKNPGEQVPGAWRLYWGEWIKLAWAVPKLRRRDGRLWWMSRLGWQVGMLQGSIAYRLPPIVFLPRTRSAHEPAPESSAGGSAGALGDQAALR